MPTPWDNLVNSNPQSQELKRVNSIPKIAIAIPYNNNWIPEWVQRTYLPLMSQPTNWCEKQIFLSSVPSISVARNMLVKQALDTNCDYILFLDTDHVVESPSHPNMALSVLHSVMNKSKDKNSEGFKDGRIASGLYRAKQKQGFSNSMWVRANDDIHKGYTPVMEWTGNWLSVDVVGMGFCLIDMAVFRENPPPWFVWNEHPAPSEDFYFCELAKKYGFDTRVMTDVKLSHIGTLKVMSDGSITTRDL